MWFTPFICVARKKVKESKHHSAANELISEQERFNRTNKTFALHLESMKVIYIAVEVVGLFLWSGWLAVR